MYLCASVCAFECCVCVSLCGFVCVRGCSRSNPLCHCVENGERVRSVQNRYLNVFAHLFGLRSMDGIRTLDLLQLLQDRFVILSGGRDRRGGPLLSFPSTPRRDRVKPEDMRRVLTYMFGIPGDAAKAVGFTVIVDMRGNGNNMTSVKTILKILQENFCATVHHVVIIKPDNFWQKQRASIASHKYKFEASLALGID